MSNDAYLYSSTRPGPPGTKGDKRLSSAAYLVPVCWLASLDARALRRIEDEEAGEDEDTQDVYFEISGDSALQLFESRREVLGFIVENTEDWAPSWVSFLSAHAGKTLKIDVSELCDMDEEFASQLADALRVFDGPDATSMKAFLSATCLSDVFDQKTRRVVDPKTGKSAGSKADQYMVGDHYE